MNVLQEYDLEIQLANIVHVEGLCKLSISGSKFTGWCREWENEKKH